MSDPERTVRSPRPTRSLVASAGVLVALGALAPGAGAAAVYGGSLTRGGTTIDPIVLTADPHANVLKGAVIGWTASCDSGYTYEFARTLKVYPASSKVIHFGEFAATRNAHGAFRATSGYSKATSTGSALESMTIAGKLQHGSGSGTLKADVTFTDVPPLVSAPPDKVTVLDTCTAGTMRWKTTRGAGVVYGGATSNGDPVVVKLTRNRRTVDEFDAGWSADFQPDGRFNFPGLPFAAYPLDAKGGFGDESSQQIGDGVWDFEAHGRVGRTAASGGFQDKVTFSDATVCDSGALTWSARTG